ncbi:MAG TPA: alpha/beta hydrolase [Polyangiaceae bacterium]|nr:alpha/beta hydrolase [Polyangiaceae bacterium]
MSSLTILAQPPRPPSLAQLVQAQPNRVALGNDVGCVGYYAATVGREGPPLVLLHSINAAASSNEMRPLFEAFRDRQIYALDWPGFGLSDRGPRAYTPALYAEALTRFLRTVAAPGGEPVDIVALSLSSEVAARVAVQSRALVRSLVLLSPTGLSEVPARPQRLHRTLDAFAKSRLASELFFSLLTTRPAIRHYLKKSFYGPVDEDLAEHAYLSARAPGARFAPLAFLRGSLSTPNAYFELYQQLKVPTFVLYDRDAYTSFERLPQLTRLNPFVRALRVEPTQGLPHFEQGTQVELALRAFYDSIEITDLVEHRIDTVPLPDHLPLPTLHALASS